jgi:hypothetical protein
MGRAEVKPYFRLVKTIQKEQGVLNGKSRSKTLLPSCVSIVFNSEKVCAWSAIDSELKCKFTRTSSGLVGSLKGKKVTLDRLLLLSRVAMKFPFAKVKTNALLCKTLRVS